MILSGFCIFTHIAFSPHLSLSAFSSSQPFFIPPFHLSLSFDCSLFCPSSSIISSLSSPYHSSCPCAPTNLSIINPSIYLSSSHLSILLLPLPFLPLPHPSSCPSDSLVLYSFTPSHFLLITWSLSVWLVEWLKCQ